MKVKNTEIKIVYGKQVREIVGKCRPNEKAIRQAFSSVLKRAKQANLKVLRLAIDYQNFTGFPLVGVAKILSQEIIRHVKFDKPTIKEIVISLSDKKIFEIVNNIVSGYITHIEDSMGDGPYVTVDAIIEIDGGIILIERSNPPYGWALPGGFVDVGESLEDAVRREAKEETNMELVNLKQFHAYSDPKRDPRFHTVGIVFTAKGKGKPKFGDDAKGLKIIKCEDLLKIDYAFDHKQIIKDYIAKEARWQRS